MVARGEPSELRVGAGVRQKLVNTARGPCQHGDYGRSLSLSGLISSGERFGDDSVTAIADARLALRHVGNRQVDPPAKDSLGDTAYGAQGLARRVVGTRLPSSRRRAGVWPSARSRLVSCPLRKPALGWAPCLRPCRSSSAGVCRPTTWRLAPPATGYAFGRQSSSETLRRLSTKAPDNGVGRTARRTT